MDSYQMPLRTSWAVFITPLDRKGILCMHTMEFSKRIRRTLTFLLSYMLPVDYFMLQLIPCLYVMSVMSCASILRTA